jgi:GNAT superfamily N-acetyltransferase
LEYGRGTMTDLSSIVALAQAEFGKDYTDPVSKFGLLTLLTVGFWIRLCRDDHSILTCKDASNDLIGYVEVSPQPAGEVSGPFPLPKWAKGLMGPLTPYLANLLVRPDARRRGVGGALVVACEQEAASWGDGVLGLHHDRTDQKLVRFYRKLGFAGDGVPLKHQGFELVYVAKRVRPS